MAKKNITTVKKSTIAKKTPSKVKIVKKSRKRGLLFGLGFAVVGVALLVKSFAATGFVNYYGELTSANPSAQYKLTTAAGEMSVNFSNNTADVRLTITNKAGVTIGKLDSIGKKDVQFKANVAADTYTFSLTTEKAFNKKKGYSAKIYYPVPDKTSPTAFISAPLNQTTLKGTVDFTATATDDTGVKDVKFYAADKLLATDTSAPYSTKWDTTTVADGQVVLKVVATDTSGNQVEASGTTVVKNGAEAVQRFPGDPNPKVTKKAYWGSSIGGNGDPSRHENPAGKSLAVRRTFYQWSDSQNMNSDMYKNIENDLANNRLPFISTKMPSWADVGAGKYDAQIDTMLRKLDSYGKPIWYVAHHEPEGGGCKPNCPGPNGEDDASGPAGWRAMQSRIRQRMNVIGTKNIAFMPVVMSYTWSSASGRNPNDWWVDGIWDAYIVDHYCNFDCADKGQNPLTSPTWDKFVNWIEAKGLPYGTAEWGNRYNDAAAAQEMRDFWNWSFNNKKDVIVYAYFDSSLNSEGGAWTLEGEPLKTFQDILKNDTKVQRLDTLKK